MRFFRKDIHVDIERKYQDFISRFKNFKDKKRYNLLTQAMKDSKKNITGFLCIRRNGECLELPS